MTFNKLALRAGALLARLGQWALRRARERSTWIGLATAASALGYSTAGQHLTSLADIVPMILGASGLALAGATTSHHPPPTTQGE